MCHARGRLASAGRVEQAWGTHDRPWEGGSPDKVLVCFVFPMHVRADGLPHSIRLRKVFLVLRGSEIGQSWGTRQMDKMAGDRWSHLRSARATWSCPARRRQRRG